MTFNHCPRRRFTDLQRVAFFNAHKGICYLCSQKIDGTREKWEIEHIIPREIMGTDADKDDNLALAHADCHRAKTAIDRKAIAKSNAVQAKHIGAHRPKHNWGKQRLGNGNNQHSATRPVRRKSDIAAEHEAQTE